MSWGRPGDVEPGIAQKWVQVFRCLHGIERQGRFRTTIFDGKIQDPADVPHHEDGASKPEVDGSDPQPARRGTGQVYYRCQLMVMAGLALLGSMTSVIKVLSSIWNVVGVVLGPGVSAD